MYVVMFLSEQLEFALSVLLFPKISSGFITFGATAKEKNFYHAVRIAEEYCTILITLLSRLA